MSVALSLSIIFLGSLLAIKLLKPLRLPMVTLWLLVGIAIGPELLNLVPPKIINASGIYSEIVLGMIAFSIGEGFSVSNLKRAGKSVIAISIGEVVVSWALVSICMYFFLRVPLYVSLLFGAVAPATAPAATIMVMREYKTKGPVTSTLLGVVAIDDAWGLIIFAVTFAVAKSSVQSANINMLATTGLAIIKVIISFAIGGALGFGSSYFSRFMKTKAEMLVYTLGLIFLGVGLAKLFDLSVLLTNMALGTSIINLDRRGKNYFAAVKTVDTPFYLLFFVLVGAGLNFKALIDLKVLGTVYFITRPFGEYVGAYIGATVSKASKIVRNYLGLGLIPQAGVALGMAIYIKAYLPAAGNIIVPVVIGTTVIYELIGPLFTKFALSKAGEIGKGDEY